MATLQILSMEEVPGCPSELYFRHERYEVNNRNHLAMEPAPPHESESRKHNII